MGPNENDATAGSPDAGESILARAGASRGMTRRQLGLLFAGVTGLLVSGAGYGIVAKTATEATATAPDGASQDGTIEGPRQLGGCKAATEPTWTPLPWRGSWQPIPVASSVSPGHLRGPFPCSLMGGAWIAGRLGICARDTGSQGQGKAFVWQPRGHQCQYAF